MLCASSSNAHSINNASEKIDVAVMFYSQLIATLSGENHYGMGLFVLHAYLPAIPKAHV